MAIGTCDNCGKQSVPVKHFGVDYEAGIGCDTTQCFICQGDSDPDPYGEIEGSDAWNEANGQFGVGA